MIQTLKLPVLFLPVLCILHIPQPSTVTTTTSPGLSPFQRLSKSC